MKIARALMRLLIIILAVCGELSAASYEPFAVYLTWQRDPTTTMTIQWINPVDVPANEIEFHAAGDIFWTQAQVHAHSLPGENHYHIYRLELTELTPNLDYFFRIGGSEGKIFNFRTMPATNEIPIRFVVGGDVYHDGLEKVLQTNRQAALKSPWFALLGGDLAYAGDKFGILPEGWQSWMDKLLAKADITPAKRQRWFDWLSTWKQTMVTPEGRLIPLIPALGNHDVNGGFGKTAEDAQLFHSLFPFPGKKGFQTLNFGKYLTLIVLDTGHTNPVGGEQTRWLYDKMRASGDFTHKFALYHVPAYPSIRKFNNKTSSEVRHFWVPLFEMYGLTAAFEHHDHAYKRTFPIRSGKIDPQGVLFFGDGGWGVEEPRERSSNDKRWYLANSASKSHFIMVTIKGKEKHYAAVDSNGVIFDELLSGN